MQKPIELPSVAVIQKRLAAVKTEASYLRRLLPIAQERETAERLREEADLEGSAQ